MKWNEGECSLNMRQHNVQFAIISCSKEPLALIFTSCLTGRMATTEPDQSSSIEPSWAPWRGWSPSSRRTTQGNGEMLIKREHWSDSLNAFYKMTQLLCSTLRRRYIHPLSGRVRHCSKTLSAILLCSEEYRSQRWCQCENLILCFFLHQAAVALPPPGDVSSCQPLLWGVRQEGKCSTSW